MSKERQKLITLNSSDLLEFINKSVLYMASHYIYVVGSKPHLYA